MAKIKSFMKNKGVTLVELLVYIGIFSIILFIISSSSFYLQKIIQNNNQNYYIKNQIYYNFNVLQQYLNKSYVELSGNDLKFFDKNKRLILTQKIENNHIKNIYQNKNFIIDEYSNFQKYEISLIDKGRVIMFNISWLDNRNKIQNFTEYLIVINQNL